MYVLNKIAILKLRFYPLYLETIFVGGLIRLLVLTVPGKILTQFLKNGQSTVCPELLCGRPPMVKEIGLAVGRVAKHVPWRFHCLEQGLTAKVLLRLRGIKSTLVFGVVYGERKEMLAHAWLRCGSSVVVGGRGMDDLSIIAVLN